ncbi:hypothetical protein GCM10010492_75230 [Saccharothrix mutabilis subsp. mutabilis]|uniref:Uncharacterized protein n=1 Tax=Saccharothrix mutabilis subsp. mutabilis TaxID=66855 RepID=A0ABN0UVW9_9PSEU
MTRYRTSSGDARYRTGRLGTAGGPPDGSGRPQFMVSDNCCTKPAHATGGADARDGSAGASGTTAAATRTTSNDAVDAIFLTGPTLPLAVLRCTGDQGAAPGVPIPREKSVSPFTSTGPRTAASSPDGITPPRRRKADDRRP